MRIKPLPKGQHAPYITADVKVVLLVPETREPKLGKGEFAIRVGEPTSPFAEVTTYDVSQNVVSIQIRPTPNV